MNRQQANSVAAALGGQAWQSGGGIWLVRLGAPGGRLVVLSEDMVCEYANETAFHEGRSLKAIELPAAKPPSD